MPTAIYWLYDMRPETIAKGWTNGYPFYCGKTIFDPEFRLRQHQNEASRTSKRPVCIWLAACGRHNVRAVTIEIVPADGDWQQRERHWIAHLRKEVPICANVCDGGQGLHGFVADRRTRKEPVITTGATIKREMKRFTDAQNKGVNARRLNKMSLANLRSANVQDRSGRKTRIEKMFVL